jgi:hypothetical protein
MLNDRAGVANQYRIPKIATRVPTADGPTPQNRAEKANAEKSAREGKAAPAKDVGAPLSSNAARVAASAAL